MDAFNTDFGIDLNEVEVDTKFDTVPKADYVIQGESYSVEKSKAGNDMLQVTFEIQGPTHQGRKVFETYNIQHPNPKTVQIAAGQIKAWAIACGLTGNERLTTELIDNLMGREFVATVGIEVDKKGQYDDKNRIRKYKAYDGAINPATPVAQAAPASKPAQAPATPASAGQVPPPWER